MLIVYVHLHEFVHACVGACVCMIVHVYNFLNVCTYMCACILCMHMCGHVCVRMRLYECTLLGVHMQCTHIPYNCRYSWWV